MKPSLFCLNKTDTVATYSVVINTEGVYIVTMFIKGVENETVSYHVDTVAKDTAVMYAAISTLHHIHGNGLRPVKHIRICWHIHIPWKCSLLA